MNQILNFDFLPQRAALRRRIGVDCFCASFCVAVLMLTQTVHAQNQFDHSTTNFQLPATTLPASQSLGPRVPTFQSWPKESVSFDTLVKPASFDPPSDAQKKSSSWSSMMQSAGPAISGLKNAVTSKAGGILGGIAGKPGTGNKLNLPKMLSSLAVVLGGYFAFVWVVRKISPASNSQLPPNVVQVLGRTAFGPKQSLQLVRLGNKLVLLLNGPEGTHPIGEITDTHEVQQLTALCRGSRHPNHIPFAQQAASTSPNTVSNPTNHSALNASGSLPVTNEQVQHSLTSVLRTLENATRQQGRGTSYEA